jgi:DNA primase
MLVTLMARYPDVRRQVEVFGPGRLFGPLMLPVAAALLKNAGDVDDSRLLELVEDPEARSRVASLLIDDGQLAGIDADKAFRQCCASLAKEELKDMKSLARQLAGLDTDSAEYRQLLGEIDHLRNKKSKLS